MNEGQCLELEFASVEPLYRGRLSALHRQESSLFTLGIGSVFLIVVGETHLFDYLFLMLISFLQFLRDILR